MLNKIKRMLNKIKTALSHLFFKQCGNCENGGKLTYTPDRCKKRDERFSGWCRK